MLDYLINVSHLLRHLPPERMHDFANSLSETQYRSKKWLVDTLCKQTIPEFPSILILGGWYGSYLVPMLQSSLDPSHIMLTDIDCDTLSLAESLHGVKYNNISTEIQTGMIDVNRDLDVISKMDYDIVIKTSCEHMFNIDGI